MPVAIGCHRLASLRPNLIFLYNKVVDDDGLVAGVRAVVLHISISLLYCFIITVLLLPTLSIYLLLRTINHKMPTNEHP